MIRINLLRPKAGTIRASKNWREEIKILKFYNKLKSEAEGGYLGINDPEFAEIKAALEGEENPEVRGITATKY